MPSAHDFFVTGEDDVVRTIVADVLQANGFALSTTPKGGLLAKRGSAAKTLWLGALAGKDLQVTFEVEFFHDANAHAARLNRNLAGAALKGGAIGAKKTDDAFMATANSIAAALQAAGVLAGHRPV